MCTVSDRLSTPSPRRPPAPATRWIRPLGLQIARSTLYRGTLGTARGASAHTAPAALEPRCRTANLFRPVQTINNPRWFNRRTRVSAGQPNPLEISPGLLGCQVGAGIGGFHLPQRLPNQVRVWSRCPTSPRIVAPANPSEGSGEHEPGQHVGLETRRVPPGPLAGVARAGPASPPGQPEPLRLHRSRSLLD
jgi:hypothetical protein